jgi:hypothetical protein
MTARALRAGLCVGEVPSFEAPRRFGESHLRTVRDGWRVLRTLVRERVRPAHPAELPAASAAPAGAPAALSAPAPTSVVDTALTVGNLARE